MGRIRLALALTACLGALVASGPAACQEPDGPTDAVTVEVVGVALLDAGKPEQDVHREAMLDASRNALLQCHVLVEVEKRVVGQRLADDRFRSTVTGHLESLEVLESGPVAGADPPLYRVRARAVVRPVPDLLTSGAVSLNRDQPWLPRVLLLVKGDEGQRVESALAGALRRCGVVVADPEEPGPALELQAELHAERADGDTLWIVDWEMGFYEPEADEGGGAPVRFRGSWRHSRQGEPARDWWESLGTAMAQDAMRLWALPRWTIVRFIGADENQMGALAASLGPAVGARVRVDKEASEFAVRLPLTANPVTAMEGFLKRAGLDGQVELSDASLTRLTYRCLPGRRPPSAAETEE